MALSKALTLTGLIHGFNVTADELSTQYKDRLESGIINPQYPIYTYSPGSKQIDGVTSATSRYFANKGLLYTYREGKRVDPTHLHIKDWLDSHIEPDDMSPWNAAQYTEYGAGILLYESLPFENTMELNLNLVEGDCPGSNFCGVHFSGDVEELNNGLRSLGVNLHVTG